jgi:hypothetical protein
MTDLVLPMLRVSERRKYILVDGYGLLVREVGVRRGAADVMYTPQPSRERCHGAGYVGAHPASWLPARNTSALSPLSAKQHLCTKGT